MRKIFIVIKREYLQIVKSKAFIISTILGPVLMIALIVIPVVLSVTTKGEKKHIAVIDASGIFSELNAKLAGSKMKDGSRRYNLENVPLNGSIEKLRAALSHKVLANGISAYIYIPADILESGSAEFASQHVSDFDEIRTLSDAINSVIVEKRLNKEGLDPEKIARFTKPVGLKTVKVTAKGEEEDAGGTFAVSYILVLILYMTMFFYGAIIMRGVIEEKNNRVVEIILSSLKPFQLMMGKILGIAAVGLTQYTIWAIFGIAATSFGPSFMASHVSPSSGFKMASIPPSVFVYFVVFFLLGYFLFATLYAAVGSMVNSEKEAQQLLMPVSMLLIIPLMLMTLVLKNPNGSAAVVLSLIPFFAPMLMLMRITILMPPLSQIAASIFLLLAATAAMIWLTAKIYRVGILMYGKRPSFPEIVKWIKYR